MTTIYLTGDRAIDPLTAANLAAAAINDLVQEAHGDIEFITGDAPTGIERAVRYLIPESRLNVIARNLDEDGRPNLDLAHEAIKSAHPDVVPVLLHTAPLESKIGASAVKIFGEANVKLPMQEAILGI
jgi:hypothetical protein